MPLAGAVNDRIGPLRTLLVGLRRVLRRHGRRRHRDEHGSDRGGPLAAGLRRRLPAVRAARALDGLPAAPPRALRLRRERRRVGDLGRDRAARGRAARRARRLARGLLGQSPAARADGDRSRCAASGARRSRRTSTRAPTSSGRCLLGGFALGLLLPSPWPRDLDPARAGVPVAGAAHRPAADPAPPLGLRDLPDRAHRRHRVHGRHDRDHARAAGRLRAGRCSGPRSRCSSRA